MSESTLFSSLGKQINNYYNFGQSDGDGFGGQFIVYNQVTITHAAFKIFRGGTPTGSIVARIYTSLGAFQDQQAKAGTLIAESTNTVDVSTIPTVPTDVSFTFNSVVLAPGIYFQVVFSAAIDRSNGNLEIARTTDGGTQFGYPTIYYSGVWNSWWDWD